MTKGAPPMSKCDSSAFVPSPNVVAALVAVVASNVASAAARVAAISPDAAAVDPLAFVAPGVAATLSPE